MNAQRIDKTTTYQEKSETSNYQFSKKRKLGRITIFSVFVVYALLTLFPFYILFVRTFISTSEATNLHLWIPPRREVDMNYTVGGMAEFNNLDISRFKEDFGIPAKTYITPSWTLSRLSEELSIPEADLKRYFSPYVNYNGWIVLLRSHQFWRAFGRTAVITIIGLIGLNILSIFTGTGLARLRYGYQVWIFRLYLFSMVIPFFLILLPQYVLIQDILNLIPGYGVKGSTARELGQMAVLLMFYLKGAPLSTMLFTGYISTIPSELEDAAEIDGASRWQYILHIQMPLMKIPIASMTVIALPWIWNDFLVPFIYTDTEFTTLLPLINNFVGHYSINFQVIFTAIFVTVLPLLIIYILFRRLFIQGVMAGAVKG